VLPFVDSSPLAKQHEIGAVVEELVRREIALSTYFTLTERKNLDRILKEVEFSLSDLASGESSLKVGEITGAALFLAGSVTEAGENFVISGRLIKVENAVVLGAESVTVPKQELIDEAQSYKFRYVARQGLGLSAAPRIDLVVGGIGWKERLTGTPVMLGFGGGVSYRVLEFLQISAGINTTWTEFQFGAFDPEGAGYGNSTVVQQFFIGTGSTSYPTYSFEYSQSFVDLQAFLVWNPLKRLTLSIGGGGLAGLWNSYIKLGNLPVTFVYNSATGLPDYTNESFWIRKDVVMESGNGLLLGYEASFKAEYFLSPRLLIFFNASYRKAYAGDPFRYTFGGVAAATDGSFFELSEWQPGITPYGDSLEMDLASLSIRLGISLSF
jgi:TolB-like protein